MQGRQLDAGQALHCLVVWVMGHSVALGTQSHGHSVAWHLFAGHSVALGTQS
jgi:hypothetical protein